MATTWLNEVRAATAGSNITLSGTQTIDGVALAANDVVLVKDQTNASQNGTYTVAASSWSRRDTAITPEATTRVSEGTLNGHTQWYLATQGTITVGTTSLTFKRTPTTWNVSTVAALQAAPPTSGDDAIVSGYSSTGDLGGGTFYWEGAPPASATVSGAAAANATISGATNATPIKITTSTAHGYVTGQAVLVNGVGGNTGANGTWIITVTGTTTLVLNGSSGTGAYTSGGTVYTTKVTTSAAHGLLTNQQAMIAGTAGTTAVNGTWRIYVVDATHFSIAAQWNAAWTSGGTVGDGGTTIPSSAANGRWHRVYSGALNVRWFGARGDGSTDDTTAVQGALTTLGLNYATDSSGIVFGGGKVFLPAGTYKTTAPLTVPEGAIQSNIIIEGAGQDSTVIKGFGYYFPIIQSVWGNSTTIRTFLGVRDLTLTCNFGNLTLATWAPSTPYTVGTVITSGMSNRLLRCTTAGTSGAHRPFGQLWSGVISDPVVWITGTPTSTCQQVVIAIGTGGPLGTATFSWSTDGWRTISTTTTASTVTLGSSGLTANFSSGNYTASRYYCSPPMGLGFSTVHDTTVTDNTVQWAVIDGGCGILQFNGGEACIERVHFIEVIVGIIFDGTEVSAIRDCTFDSPNGIWITGANQRLNNPSIDADNSLGQSNVNSVEDCWFDCNQLSFASESNASISISTCNFEAGQWYGWTTAVTELKVFNIDSEGGANGWFVGSLAPFNGNASFYTTNGTFENCVIDPSSGSGPAVQASNYTPASSGFLTLATPFLRLTFKNCYLASKGSYVFVGMGIGNGYRVVDTLWGGGFTGLTAFDATSVATLAEYSDSAGFNGAYGSWGYGCVPLTAVDLNRSLALRSAGITVAPNVGNGNVDNLTNPNRSSLEITGLTGGWATAWNLTGLTGGTEGQLIEIVNLTGQTMNLLHNTSTSSSGNRLLCDTALTIACAVPVGAIAGSGTAGFSWARLKYSSSQSAWIVVDHS